LRINNEQSRPDSAIFAGSCAGASFAIRIDIAIAITIIARSTRAISAVGDSYLGCLIVSEAIIRLVVKKRNKTFVQVVFPRTFANARATCALYRIEAGARWGSYELKSE